MQNPFQTCGNCKFCNSSICKSHLGFLNVMRESNQDFIDYIKNNRHREQEVLTTQKNTQAVLLFFVVVLKAICVK